MAEALQPLQIFTVPFPGTYEIHALQGGPVVYFADGEEPQTLGKAPKARGGKLTTYTTEGRLHVLATDHAFVEVTRLETPDISAKKAADSRAAQPDPARKAAGETAAEPAQPPNAGEARNAARRQSRAKQSPAAKTNRPTTSEQEGAATGTDPARRASSTTRTPARKASKARSSNRLREPRAGDRKSTPGKRPTKKAKKKR
jgi:hypothetical protein